MPRPAYADQHPLGAPSDPEDRAGAWNSSPGRRAHVRPAGPEAPGGREGRECPGAVLGWQCAVGKRNAADAGRGMKNRDRRDGELARVPPVSVHCLAS
ncbi:MAG: hypothetical protein AMXMBFR61_26220 [Fimbriimonadales bacterium]